MHCSSASWTLSDHGQRNFARNNPHCCWLLCRFACPNHPSLSRRPRCHVSVQEAVSKHASALSSASKRKHPDEADAVDAVCGYGHGYGRRYGHGRGRGNLGNYTYGGYSGGYSSSASQLKRLNLRSGVHPYMVTIA